MYNKHNTSSNELLKMIYINDKCALPFEFIHPYKLSVFFVCVHKISLIPPLYIEVSVPSQDSDRSCICVRVLIFASFNGFSIRFRNCSDSVVFFVFLLDLGTVPTVSYF